MDDNAVSGLYSICLHPYLMYDSKITDNNNNNNKIVLEETNNNLKLPIIDFADLHGPNCSQLLKSLACACEHYGFFQLVNHGIGSEIIRETIDVCGRFFEQALEEREKCLPISTQ
ncbi:hypothetical protein LguiA_029356 [Lonicera macranthoides]